MRNVLRTTALLGALLSACAPARTQGIRDIEPRPMAAANDPVNRQAADGIDALILTLTIDSTSVTLDRATLARVPRTAAQRSTGEGDRVTVIGFAGGTRVSETSAPDANLNTQEGVGLVNLTRRQVILTLPAPRALDTIEVNAPSTRATARLDVRAAYARYCPQYNRDNRFCPVPRQP